MRAETHRLGRRVRFSFVVAPLLCAALLGGSRANVEAKPEYAKKENKPCLYCHLSATPGAFNSKTTLNDSTDRNLRGLYYAAHKLSFAGYDELAVMGKDSEPLYHLVWKEEFRDLPRRAAVADVMGDGKPRLITLNEQAGKKTSSLLRVQKWDGDKFGTEFTAGVQTPPDKLAVGKFAGPNKPAVILTANFLWFWNGQKFVSKPLARPLNLMGITRMRSGEERVLVLEGAMSVKAFRVSLEAAGGEWLTDGVEMMNASEWLWRDLHGTPEFFEQTVGLTETVAAGGMIGLLDPRRFGTLFLYYAKVVQDFDSKPDPNNPTKSVLVIKAQRYYVTFINLTGRTGNAPEPKPQKPGLNKTKQNAKGTEPWETVELGGLPYDVGIEDPKGSGKPGLFVLAGGSSASAGRSLYFFALD